MPCAGIAIGAITSAEAAEVALIEEWELWACAHHYIKRHGEDAAILAAMRADELSEEGDLAGAKTFRAIVRRINELTSTGPDNVH